MLGLGLISCQNNEIKVNVVGMEDKAKIILLTYADKTGNIIYNHLKQEKDIPQRYGENDWILTYSDSLCARFRHIKYNRRDTHSYFFSFFKSGEHIYCKVLIKGESPIDDTLKLDNCRLLKLPSK